MSSLHADIILKEICQARAIFSHTPSDHQCACIALTWKVMMHIIANYLPSNLEHSMPTSCVHKDNRRARRWCGKDCFLYLLTIPLRINSFIILVRTSSNEMDRKLCWISKYLIWLSPE
jgi:hypothetical protein